jgi:alpha-N-acetylglucosamine transferase
MALQVPEISSDKIWASLITNTNYLPGLLTLHRSLVKSGTAYPLLALTTPAFPASGRAALAARGIPSRDIPFLAPPEAGGARDFANEPRFLDTWTKLAVFNLTPFSRVVLLDSDMLVLRNMDELMDLPLDTPPAVPDPAPAPAPDSASAQIPAEPLPIDATGSRVFAASHACTCNPLKKPHYPASWIPENCAFTTQHADPDRAQTAGAPPKPWPRGALNSGLLVVNPSPAYYAQITHYLQTRSLDHLAFPDQDLLSDLYSGRWVAIPYVYNALKTLRWKGVHDAIWRDDSVKNVHYILAPKPWDELDAAGVWTGTDEMHRWWADVNDERKVAERANGVPDDGH